MRPLIQYSIDFECAHKSNKSSHRVPKSSTQYKIGQTIFCHYPSLLKPKAFLQTNCPNNLRDLAKFDHSLRKKTL